MRCTSIFKNEWIFLLCNIALSILLFLFLIADYTFVNYINVLFYISFIYILTASLLFVIKGKFIDGITYGFRRFRDTMSNQQDYLEEWKERPFLSEKINAGFQRAISFQAWALLLVLIVLLIIYYI